MLSNLTQRSIILNRSFRIHHSIQFNLSSSIIKSNPIKRFASTSEESIEFKLPSSKSSRKSTSETGVHLNPIGRKKLKTDQVGIEVHQSPFKTLIETYQTTLNVLKKFPSGSIYRQSVESLTQKNLQLVQEHDLGEGSHDPEEVEKSIKALEIGLGVNLIEEAIDQAQDEHSLTLSIFDSEAWSDLIEKPSEGQWDPFTVPSSTSYPKP
ncbi:hypothetical protein DFH28DRAFT_9779 [Melampsora americana]|nr:hypothetical protein DFH28DRAFT_9779 [Melampsora americana]